MLKEAFINIKQIWFLGNNRAKNLRIVQPAWNYPFFLTTDFEYAKDYADYGVYKVILNDSVKSEILDFSNNKDIKKLNWPKLLINQIQSGKSDLNSIAFDLYSLIYGDGRLYRIQKTKEWLEIAKLFAKKSKKPFINIKHSHWQDDKDNLFVLTMWRDIFEAGFNGFIQKEFNHQILALFSIDCIDKISINKILNT